MDPRKRLEDLRGKVRSAEERLANMESALERADQEILVLNSKLASLRESLRTMKRPGLAVSLEEYAKVRAQSRETVRRIDTLTVESFSVRKAMWKVEEALEMDARELSDLAATTGSVTNIRSGDGQGGS